MKSGFYFKLIPLLAIGFMLVSCTVKEERVPCPSLLHVSFPERESMPEQVGLLAWDDAERFRTEVSVAECDPYWEKLVKKGMFTLTAFNRKASVTSAGHHVMIPVGSECDSLYACHRDVDATGDDAYAEVTLYKQFVTVMVSLHRVLPGMNTGKFIIDGNTCGFDLLNFTPVPGTYHMETEIADVSDMVSFRIPRQNDNSLSMLTVINGNDYGVIPIGELIAFMGYNWNAESLSDVMLLIDVTASSVYVSVDGWEEGAYFDIVRL